MEASHAISRESNPAIRVALSGSMRSVGLERGMDHSLELAAIATDVLRRVRREPEFTSAPAMTTAVAITLGHPLPDPRQVRDALRKTVHDLPIIDDQRWGAALPVLLGTVASRRIHLATPDLHMGRTASPTMSIKDAVDGIIDHLIAAADGEVSRSFSMCLWGAGRVESIREMPYPIAQMLLPIWSVETLCERTWDACVTAESLMEFVQENYLLDEDVTLDPFNPEDLIPGLCGVCLRNSWLTRNWDDDEDDPTAA
jgi:hypothetical protein